MHFLVYNDCLLYFLDRFVGYLKGKSMIIQNNTVTPTILKLGSQTFAEIQEGLGCFIIRTLKRKIAVLPYKLSFPTPFFEVPAQVCLIPYGLYGKGETEYSVLGFVIANQNGEVVSEYEVTHPVQKNQVVAVLYQGGQELRTSYRGLAYPFLALTDETMDTSFGPINGILHTSEFDGEVEAGYLLHLERGTFLTLLRY